VELLTVLLVILVLAAIVACIAGVWAFREVGSAARSVKLLADDTGERLVPLIEKMDVTVDAVNAELLRVDMLVTQFEDAAQHVTKASTTISDIANAPERIAGGVADRVRAWRGRKRPDRQEETDSTLYAEPDVELDIDIDTVEQDEYPTEDPWQQTE
jgi:hypothetical protein